LDELPVPARHLTNRYRQHYHLGFQKPSSIMETARGCPYRCDFCSVWKFFQGKCRMKSAERVFHEIKTVREKYIFLADDNFLLSELYKAGYAWSQIGWEGVAAILRNTFSLSHLIAMKRAAWASVEPLNYLAGHDREVLS
jgi:radical SAM superfamily enzyme YgiQ (UPF0313 family)